MIDHLPGNIADGLNEPFGGKFEPAWRDLLNLAPTAHKSWIVALGARTHEMSSFLSAAFFATLAFFLFYGSPADRIRLVKLAKAHIHNAPQCDGIYNLLLS
jgi:hypothetical protein